MNHKFLSILLTCSLVIPNCLFASPNEIETPKASLENPTETTTSGALKLDLEDLSAEKLENVPVIISFKDVNTEDVRETKTYYTTFEEDSEYSYILFEEMVGLKPSEPGISLSRDELSFDENGDLYIEKEVDCTKLYHGYIEFDLYDKKDDSLIETKTLECYLDLDDPWFLITAKFDGYTDGYVSLSSSNKEDIRTNSVDFEFGTISLTDYYREVEVYKTLPTKFNIHYIDIETGLPVKSKTVVNEDLYLNKYNDSLTLPNSYYLNDDVFKDYKFVGDPSYEIAYDTLLGLPQDEGYTVVDMIIPVDKGKEYNTAFFLCTLQDELMLIESKNTFYHYVLLEEQPYVYDGHSQVIFDDFYIRPLENFKEIFKDELKDLLVNYDIDEEFEDAFDFVYGETTDLLFAVYCTDKNEYETGTLKFLDAMTGEEVGEQEVRAKNLTDPMHLNADVIVDVPEGYFLVNNHARLSNESYSYYHNSHVVDVFPKDIFEQANSSELDLYVNFFDMVSGKYITNKNYVVPIDYETLAANDFKIKLDGLNDIDVDGYTPMVQEIEYPIINSYLIDLSLGISLESQKTINIGCVPLGYNTQKHNATLNTQLNLGEKTYTEKNKVNSFDNVFNYNDYLGRAYEIYGGLYTLIISSDEDISEFETMNIKDLYTGNFDTSKLKTYYNSGEYFLDSDYLLHDDDEELSGFQSQSQKDNLKQDFGKNILVRQFNMLELLSGTPYKYEEAKQIRSNEKESPVEVTPSAAVTDATNLKIENLLKAKFDPSVLYYNTEVDQVDLDESLNIPTTIKIQREYLATDGSLYNPYSPSILNSRAVDQHELEILQPFSSLTLGKEILLNKSYQIVGSDIDVFDFSIDYGLGQIQKDVFNLRSDYNLNFEVSEKKGQLKINYLNNKNQEVYPADIITEIPLGTYDLNDLVDNFSDEIYSLSIDNPIVSINEAHLANEINVYLTDKTAKGTVTIIYKDLDGNEIVQSVSATYEFGKVVIDAMDIPDYVPINGNMEITLSEDEPSKVIVFTYKKANEKTLKDVVYDKSVLEIPFGTTKGDVLDKLPQSVTLEFEDGSSEQLDINTWIDSDYEEDAPQDYLFVSNLVLPDYVRNSNNVLLKVDKVVRLLPKELVAIEYDESILEVPLLTEKESIVDMLPTSVTLIFSDDSTEEAVIQNWDSLDYNDQEPQDYEFSGQVELPLTVSNNNHISLRVTKTVRVKPAEVVQLELVDVLYDKNTITVPYGTDVSIVKQALPTTITLVLSNNKTQSLTVNEWVHQYDKSVSTTYPFTSEVTLPDNISNTRAISLEILKNVEVLPKEEVQEDRILKDVKYSAPLIEVSYGTSLEKVQTLLPVEVTLTYSDNSSSKVTINNWSNSDYNGSISSEYTFKSDIPLPEDVLNSNDLNLKIDRIVKVLPKPSISHSSPSSSSSSSVTKPKEEVVNVVQRERVKITFKINDSNIYINDEKQSFVMDVKPELVNGRAYVPIRFLSYAMSIKPQDVVWDSSDRSANIKDDTNYMSVFINSSLARLNQKDHQMDGMPHMTQDRIMLPISQILPVFEHRNPEVLWNEKDKVVDLWFDVLHYDDTTSNNWYIDYKIEK